MTNPDNIVRVRARNGGRASVYEANGWAQAYTTGLIEGNGVVQNTSADMHVLVGGSATKPDVILAENPAGYKIALDLVGQQAITLTNPATNSRISAIVAYTDDLAIASSEDTITGSPASCGLIVVNGTASSSPTEPTDNQIRTAITADGATGSQAAYCVIATVLVANDTTTITDSLITMNQAKIGSNIIDFGNYSLNEKDTGFTWIDGKKIYSKTVGCGAITQGNNNTPHGISNLGTVIKIECTARSDSGNTITIPQPADNPLYDVTLVINNTNISITCDSDRSAYKNIYCTVYYTKTS